MIKFSSKIGTTMFLFFALMCVLNICTVLIWGIFNIWVPFVVITVINVIFVFPMFFGTFYCLKEGELVINSFWFFVNKKIKYEDIVVAVPKTKFCFGPALASDGIEIVYKQNKKTKSIFVSPALFETFLDQLTDNILVSVVMLEKRAEQSPETKKYLLKRQEIEEQKAKNSKQQNKTDVVAKPRTNNANKKTESKKSLSKASQKTVAKNEESSSLKVVKKSATKKTSKTTKKTDEKKASTTNSKPKKSQTKTTKQN